jgi:hypothetical protein
MPKHREVAVPSEAVEGFETVAPKDLTVTSMEDLKEKVSDVEIFGDPGAWELVCKASSERQGWMKSTKRLTLRNGHLYQTETQQRNPDGSYALSQSSVFVPA